MRGNGLGQRCIEHRAEQMPHETFHEGHDLVTRQERGFDVELREFRLAVGAQVLVAEAAHDLVVAIEARRSSAAA